MSGEKPLSEAAQWFLEDLQKILDDFANRENIQVVIINKEGELVNEVKGVQRACRLILSTEEGRIRCRDHFKSALSVVRSHKKPFFTECYAGFVSVWMPIIIKGSLIGAIIACGGRYEKKKEKAEKEFSRLADELGIFDVENFVKAGTDEKLLVFEEGAKKRAEQLKELFDILSKTAHTPLKEVFG